jgi:hypothetical protein
MFIPLLSVERLYYANAERLIFARKVTVPAVDSLDEPPASSRDQRIPRTVRLRTSTPAFA